MHYPRCRYMGVQMLRFSFALLFVCVLASTTIAKTFSVPAKNSAVTVTIPDSWETEQIDFGYNAQSPDGSVFFFIESATASRLEVLLKNNRDWMEEQEIVLKGEPVISDIIINGIPAQLHHFDATDENGDTTVDFVLMDAGAGRVIMFTLWGSISDLKNNATDVNAIKASIQPIKK